MSRDLKLEGTDDGDRMRVMSKKSTQESSACCECWQKLSLLLLSCHREPDVSPLLVRLSADCVKLVTSPSLPMKPVLRKGSQQECVSKQAQSLDRELVLNFRKAPDCTAWFIVRGFHRNKRLVTELKGQTITAAYDGMCSHMWFWFKSCKCTFAITSMSFCPPCVTFALLCEAWTFPNPSCSQMCGMSRKVADCLGQFCSNSSVTHKPVEGCSTHESPRG